MAKIDAIPCNWREILKTNSHVDDFVPQNEIYLKLLNIRIPISIKLFLKASMWILNLESQQHQQPKEDTHICLVNIL